MKVTMEIDLTLVALAKDPEKMLAVQTMQSLIELRKALQGAYRKSDESGRCEEALGKLIAKIGDLS